MLVFQVPIQADSNRKIAIRNTFETSMNKRHQFCSKVMKKLSTWSPKTQGLLSAAAMGRQAANMAPQGAKMEAPGLPNNILHFWGPRITVSALKKCLFVKCCENIIQKPASKHTQRPLEKQNTISKNPTS